MVKSSRATSVGGGARDWGRGGGRVMRHQLVERVVRVFKAFGVIGSWVHVPK